MMKGKTPRRAGVVLPVDACPECATKMNPGRGPLSFPVNGEEMKGLRVSHLRCPSCGEGMFTAAEAKELRERAFAKYRKKHGLLTAEDIRDIREQLGMSQRDLARRLHLGEVTVSRWESNRVIQTAALDLLLRLMRDVPEVRKYIQNGRQAA